ncbi:MAG: LrgB family protein [Candidatus Competibacterales bacterium]
MESMIDAVDVAQLRDIWVYLAASPLLWLTLTVVVYTGSLALYRHLGEPPLLNPVLLSVAVLGGLLLVTDTAYQVYFEGAQFIHFLLGPATVALAIPLYQQLPRVRQLLGPMVLGLVLGSGVAILGAMAVAFGFGGDRETVLSLAPKSVTTPIAMGIAEKIGGLPSFTAVLVILTGITGAVVAPWLLRRLKVRDRAVQGFAMGLASHGIGAARAFQLHPRAGAFAGLAMAFNALFTALLVPLLVPWLGRWWGF